MFIEWLHSVWKYFWSIVVILLLTILVVSGSLFGILQLEQTKNYIARQIEADFAHQYHGELIIAELNGLLPFRIEIDSISIFAPSDPDSLQADPVVYAERLQAQIDVWSLLQNKVSITGFSLLNPGVYFRDNGKKGYTITQAFTRRTELTAGQTPWIANIEIVAPSVSIDNGTLYMGKLHNETASVRFGEPLEVHSINASMFVELSETQRYLDIASLKASSSNFKMKEITLTGQVYNDRRYLEFNAFNISTPLSNLQINGEIDGVDLYRPGLEKQLLQSGYDLQLSSGRLRTDEFDDLLPGLPVINQPLSFDMDAEGIPDSLWIDRFSFGAGDSYFSINGLIKNIFDRSQLSYEFRIDNVFLRKRDVELFTGVLNERQFDALENLAFSGRARGSDDSLYVDLDLQSPWGSIELIGNTRLAEPFEYHASLSARQVNLANLMAAGMDTTNLNFDARINGIGFGMDGAIMDFTAAAYDSRIDGFDISELEINGSLAEGLLEQKFTYRDAEEIITGEGWLDLSNEERPFALKGAFEKVNLANLFHRPDVPSTSLNFTYNFEWQGTDIDRLQGRANIDVFRSVIAGDTLRPHQFYVDLDAPGQEIRNLRLTSSMFDLNVHGQIVPTNIHNHYRAWADYLAGRYRSEILLSSGISPAADSIRFHLTPLQLNGELVAKDLGLIHKYLQDFPDIKTNGQLQFDISADSERLLVSVNSRTDTLRYPGLDMRNGNMSLTASFRNNRSLKEYATIDLETKIDYLRRGDASFDSIHTDLSVRRDSIQLHQRIGNPSDNSKLDIDLLTHLTDSTVQMTIRDFYVGNETYAWTNESTPVFRLNRNGDLDLENVSFRNQDEFFHMEGTFSPDPEKSVEYIIRGINLQRISDFIPGRVDFRGRLNGTLTTRSLTRTPSVQGRLDINRFALNDRLIGDVDFTSKYNQDEDRFDTRISVVTDTARYAEYIEQNDGIGQNIVLNGYFIPPDPGTPGDRLFYFDVDLKQVDTWFLTVISPNVFNVVEGRAEGKGYLSGNLDDIDFRADFDTYNVFIKPRFLNTNYFASGHVILDRQEGVILNSIGVTDTKGGTAVVNGTVDLNNFEPTTYLDLTFDLNQLQFLNNEFDPDVPFFGSVSGSGIVQLTGPNTNIFMRSVNPIQLTGDSKISIPLLEETEVSESNRFIEFVEAFNIKRPADGTHPDGPASGSSVSSDFIESLTFTERFRIDLQFITADNIGVDLIFDPVTGDILRSQGNGRLRITLEDEEVRMFGQYNITGGEYQFVSGDIFSRRLELVSGGSIVWEGDPDNARLNIEALYRTRPNISLLTPQGASVVDDLSQGQRIPVELIVEITGTVSSVENNYYFRLPATQEISSNVTLTETINSLNRDEQQKLIQATAILLTGNFIPYQDTYQASANIGQSLTRGSTVINPILSSQVISPLLSNQVNNLLNSDVSQLDVDFNLNAYNEIDLGLALRLYNDRLILRREGQITGGDGENSIGERIGDLNATYRINRGLSVTAFHRQDQTLNSVTNSPRAADISPTVDGVGLEAEVQFNTWKELGRKIVGIFRGIFGSNNKKDEESRNTEEDFVGENSNRNNNSNR